MILSRRQEQKEISASEGSDLQHVPRGHSVFFAGFLPTFKGLPVVCGVKTVLVGCLDGIMSLCNKKKTFSLNSI